MTQQEFNVERFTTEYSQQEDRIRFVVTNAELSVQQLWLTRRLLNRFLPPLIQILQKEVGETQSAPSIQTFNQQRAALGIKHEPPVTATAETLTWLVSRVDMTPAASLVRIVFSNQNKQQVFLNLPVTSLCQWISILRELYLRAEWSETFWPDWIEPLSISVNPKTHQLH